MREGIGVFYRLQWQTEGAGDAAATRQRCASCLRGPVGRGLRGIPATQLRLKAKGAFLRSALDGSQIRTIFERLISDDYGWRGAVAAVTWGGQINSLGPQDTAVAERDSVALFSVGNFWDNPEEDEKHLTWNRTLYRDVFAATGGVPVPNDRTGGCYINWPAGIFWKRNGTNQAFRGPSCTTAGTTRNSRK